MDKKILGVIAAVASLAPMAGARAAPTAADVEHAMNASSFAELLQSVPNASAILEAAQELKAQEGPAAGVELAQFHHHHHHDWRWHHHHHHFWWHNHWYHHHHHHHYW